jgi:Arc/MetJ-type ribon-helix-helix transcriptional regulator
MRRKIIQGLEALVAAEDRASDSSFVRDCRRFFNERGFLTQKQIEALEQVEDSDDARDYYDGFDPMDLYD